MTEKIPVIAVLGPTASGKTSLAVAIAARFDGEVVSCDSMQIYKNLSIATAKPTAEDMRGIPHHLIDFLPPSQAYSVADYVQAAQAAIRDIHAQGKTVVLCGGTGLYADALLDGMSFAAIDVSAEKRAEIRNYYETNGLAATVARLAAADPAAPAQIDVNNPKRALRALEICESTGRPLAEYRQANLPSDTPYRVLRLVIDFADREALYARIHRRAEMMLDAGLIEETKAYYALPQVSTASQAIGYKELKPWLDGEVSLETAVENLKKATRHYAKRQQSWFRRSDDAVRLYADREDITARAFALCEDFLKGDV
ncbi:MAG: tRNA (adenosine(37)-N6)-dimethylallyltransferase MiaA [Clostridia bacterium]|nr:tRNA (adenosine(37)-N6)-dimethylallyltransferase MiaA [Clostridia bacterium]